MSPQFASPDLVVFFFGLLVTAVLYVLRVRGAIVWGMLAATGLALALHHGLPAACPRLAQSPLVTGSKLETQFAPAEAALCRDGLVAMPTLAPTLLKLDFVHSLSRPMIPFILIFLFMVLFDTLGTLIGVTEQAGLIRNNKLPRAKQALVSDAIGTVAGAALGTSTVTSFIESAAGVEQGGRTGLTAVVVAGLFLVAMVLSPLAALVGSYPPITAPALVVVGSLMMRSVAKIDWDNYAEALPSFLILVGIPLTFSIADGLALGFIAYPIVKLLAGQGRDVKWLMIVMAAVLVGYFVFVRA
jgi:AGZA family xanthine/uracil permease-like MFS transporter